ncbi:hypothetical protein J4447_00420 [Candidatus Pacearchaeota archaeon]|nr:hypothetical protein [Candidatus Pacearchaeota archaeon]
MAKKIEKKKESWLSFIIGIPLSLIIHYFTFAKLNIHPTWHLVIGLILFMATSTVIAMIVKKFS